MPPRPNKSPGRSSRDLRALQRNTQSALLQQVQDETKKKNDLEEQVRILSMQLQNARQVADNNQNTDDMDVLNANLEAKKTELEKATSDTMKIQLQNTTLNHQLKAAQEVQSVQNAALVATQSAQSALQAALQLAQSVIESRQEMNVLCQRNEGCINKICNSGLMYFLSKLTYAFVAIVIMGMVVLLALAPKPTNKFEFNRLELSREMAGLYAIIGVMNKIDSEPVSHDSVLMEQAQFSRGDQNYTGILDTLLGSSHMCLHNLMNLNREPQPNWGEFKSCLIHPKHAEDTQKLQTADNALKQRTQKLQQADDSLKQVTTQLETQLKTHKLTDKQIIYHRAFLQTFMKSGNFPSYGLSRWTKNTAYRQAVTEFRDAFARPSNSNVADFVKLLHADLFTMQTQDNESNKMILNSSSPAYKHVTAQLTLLGTNPFRALSELGSKAAVKLAVCAYIPNLLLSDLIIQRLHNSPTSVMIKKFRAMNPELLAICQESLNKWYTRPNNATNWLAWQNAGRKASGFHSLALPPPPAPHPLHSPPSSHLPPPPPPHVVPDRHYIPPLPANTQVRQGLATVGNGWQQFQAQAPPSHHPPSHPTLRHPKYFPPITQAKASPPPSSPRPLAVLSDPKQLRQFHARLQTLLDSQDKRGQHEWYRQYANMISEGAKRVFQMTPEEIKVLADSLKPGIDVVCGDNFKHNELIQNATEIGISAEDCSQFKRECVDPVQSECMRYDTSSLFKMIGGLGVAVGSAAAGAGAVSVAPAVGAVGAAVYSAVAARRGNAHSHTLSRVTKTTTETLANLGMANARAALQIPNGVITVSRAIYEVFQKNGDQIGALHNQIQEHQRIMKLLTEAKDKVISDLELSVKLTTKQAQLARMEKDNEIKKLTEDMKDDSNLIKLLESQLEKLQDQLYKQKSSFVNAIQEIAKSMTSGTNNPETLKIIEGVKTLLAAETQAMSAIFDQNQGQG